MRGGVTFSYFEWATGFARIFLAGGGSEFQAGIRDAPRVQRRS